MTYPQQPSGGQGPSGVPPQPGPHHGYYDPSAQYGGGFGAPPPRKKNTAANVVAIATAVLIVVGVGFTGFVAPGFFLAGNGTVGTSTTGTPPSTTSSAPDSNPEEYLLALVDALNSGKAATLRGITCPDTQPAVHRAISDVSSVSKAELVGSPTTSADKAVGTVEITSAKRTREFEVTLIPNGREWCWQDIAAAGGGVATAEPVPKPTRPTKAPTDPGTLTAGGKPVDPEALAAMRTFLDSVNAGDAAKAATQLCADAIKKPRDIEELVGHKPELELNPTMDGRSSGPKSVIMYLRGTAKGQVVDGHSGNLWMSKYEGPWCVHAFSVVVI
ncbi:hypothetical protein FHS29_003818 [Saccharothrix tamanrassetensis]|uniref:Uncharacterized protein n=1 Tax=Saccharothrix tamanrassetensis TaxID=1051531 RepID=A0A841CMJ9_9PSEU|nr:hypothetical protein [Saccharothrix tamanrassetensis]MBB5957225.1 hypothetical protein [Saccharothrix tamanrassetensis]